MPAEGGGRRVLAPNVSGRGRVIGDQVPRGPVGSVAVGATVRAAVMRAQSDPSPSGLTVRDQDIREAARQQRRPRLVVLTVDASGSMGADRRMATAKAAVVGLLVHAYQRRDLVALVAFRGESAEVLLRPTGSVEVARARLNDLPTGGRTPLAAGITTAVEVATSPARATHQPLLVFVTDGRATAGPAGVEPLAAASAAALQIRRRHLDAVVIDAEDGPVTLGLARQLAEEMGARYLTLPGVTADQMVDFLRTSASGGEKG
ncbi:MAG: VWA domain-containing protein [Actinomycetota bacterium]|nr:VWA domain-containing protein [Actinomycetota bacterium]